MQVSRARRICAPRQRATATRGVSAVNGQPAPRRYGQKTPHEHKAPHHLRKRTKAVPGLYDSQSCTRTRLLQPSPSYLRPSLLSKRALCDPRFLGCDPRTRVETEARSPFWLRPSGLLVTETVRPFTRFGRAQRYSSKRQREVRTHAATHSASWLCTPQWNSIMLLNWRHGSVELKV